MEEVAGGIIGLDTRRQVSAGLHRRLLLEGVTDALTGFVDASGRRWSLPSYTEMVARTTTREAMSAGTANRMTEHGLDLVTISEHAHVADECSDYEGNTYSLTGTDTRYPVLDVRPPFHPRAALGDDALIAPVGRVLSAVRAVYDGPAVEIQSATGVRARVSPHHPMLTARGWLPARLLREGDEVLRDPLVDRHPPPVTSENLDDVPARAADMFDALWATGTSRRAVPAAEDLHGDARFCQPEVDVVTADLHLWDDLDAAVTQHHRERLLVGATDDAAARASASALLELAVGRRPRVARPLPDDYAARMEPTQQRRPGEWTAERERLHTLARPVAVDEVVEVRYLDRWRGHAYDFQTEGSAYFINGVYTHNCIHVMGPAGVELDDFEAELDRAISTREPQAAKDPASVPDRPPVPDKPGTPTPARAAEPDRPPFGQAARPQRDEHSDRRLAEQRVIQADPGPDPGLLDAIVAEAKSDDAARTLVAKAERAAKRDRRAALKAQMGPELARELGFARGVKAKKWAIDDDVVNRLEAGEISVRDVEELAYEHYESVERSRELRRLDDAARFGSKNRPIPCFSCGKLKALPADVCQFCGDDPLSLKETAAEFNRAHGYFGPDAESRRGLHHGTAEHGSVREKASVWAG